jgi:hypothetical protein
MSRVDFGFIRGLEGGQRLTGYVPDADTSQSGVTVATGFDLGARNVTDLQNLGLPSSLVNKLSRYCGKQRREATFLLLQYPFSLTKQEADAIDVASKRSAISTLITLYDRALPRTAEFRGFAQLPAEAQTVIASVAFQYGHLPSRTPRFWRTVTEQRWQAAVDELRDFGDRYSTRRRKEAELLAKLLVSRPSSTPAMPPALATPPVATYGFSLFFQEQPQAQAITGSVGQGGKNTPADVQLIQTLLNSHLRVPAMPLQVNGRVDQQLINAILHFQRHAVGLSRPDGRIDPGGRTFQVLTGAAPQVATPKAAAPQAVIPRPPSKPPPVNPMATRDFCFPFTTLPSKGWESGARAFGANRSRGRKHAGCDLYFPQGTWIHAIADGKVIRPPYAFYAGTHALEIQHGDLIVRYGEIKPGSFVGGTTVTRGQRLCQVGHLLGINVESDMLHLEMYAGTESGNLTVSGNAPFQRRKDLLDPTPFLDLWAKNLSSA